MIIDKCDPAILAQYPFPQVIDNTMMDDWKTCPHKFFRAHVQGLRLGVSVGEPGEARVIFRKSILLHFGRAIARGLEVTRKEYYGGAGEMEAIARGGQAIMALWDAEPDLPEPRTKTEEVKTLDTCLLAHTLYHREWPLDDPSYQFWTVGDNPLVENSGARPIPNTSHPLTGDPLLYAGRFDGVVDRGAPIGLDDKTTGGRVQGDAWASQWKLRGQFTGYCWLAHSWGYPIEYFLIHGIQPLKTKCNFGEALESRPRWMIERWEAQLIHDVNQMISQYKRFITDPLFDREEPFSHPFSQRYNDACHHYNSPCAYLPLCTEPRPEDFEDGYVVQRWDPLERRVEE